MQAKLAAALEPVAVCTSACAPDPAGICLQDAVAAANEEPGVVMLPAGMYRLTAPLEVTRGGVVLRGAGVRQAGGSGAGL